MGSEHKITEYGKWNDRIEMLGYDILSLISDGKTETVNEIIKHFENEDVVHYIAKKYKGQMSFVCEGCQYDLNEWEKVFAQYSYMTFGHDVERKMGYCNEETDGLLVLINIILQEVSNRKYK